MSAGLTRRVTAIRARNWSHTPQLCKVYRAAQSVTQLFEFHVPAATPDAVFTIQESDGVIMEVPRPGGPGPEPGYRRWVSPGPLTDVFLRVGEELMVDVSSPTVEVEVVYAAIVTTATVHPVPTADFMMPARAQALLEKVRFELSDPQAVVTLSSQASNGMSPSCVRVRVFSTICGGGIGMEHDVDCNTTQDPQDAIEETVMKTIDEILLFEERHRP